MPVTVPPSSVANRDSESPTDPVPTPRPPRLRGRLAAVLGFALILGAMLAVPDAELKLVIGVLAVAAALGYALLSAISHFRPAPLTPDVDHFHARLPGAWPGLLGILGCVLLALAWLTLFLPKLQDMLAQSQSEFWMAFIARALIAWAIGLPTFELIVFIPILAGISPLSVNARDGRLRLNWLHRVAVMDPCELTVWRVADEKTGAVAALHLLRQGRRYVIPASKLFPGQAVFLEQLAGWLAAHGTAVVEGQRLIHEPAWRSQFRGGIILAVIPACVLLPWGVAIAIAFWVQWLLTGTLIMNVMLYVTVAGIACGTALLATPLPGWLTRLLRCAWLAPRPKAGTVPVFVMEDLHGNEFLSSMIRPAVLRAREGSLELELRRGAAPVTIRIGADAVERLEQFGLIRSSFSNLGEPFYRFLARPVQLAWREVTPEGPVIRAVSIAARSGGSNGRDRRADKELYRRIRAWHAGEAALDFTDMKTSSSRPGALAAALFLLVCCIAPPLHNHLLLTKVRTGVWRSPARYPLNRMGPLLGAPQTVNPSQMMFVRIVTGEGFSWPLLLTGDFAQGEGHPLRFGRQFLISTAKTNVQSSHDFFFPGDEALAMALIPPQPSGNAELFPAQVIDLRTGVGRDVRSLPPGVEMALPVGGRLFYVTAYDAPRLNGSVTEYLYGCIDIATDRPLWSKQGLVPASFSSPTPSAPTMAVFPGGRQVLFGMTVIDLDHGSARSVEPAEAGKVLSGEPYHCFAWGKKLVLGINTTTPGAAQTQRTYIEIDPDTARWREVKVPGGYVFSADEGRWLVNEGKVATNANTPPLPWTFSLFDPATGRQREIFREVPQGQYFLVRGRDEILIYTGEQWIRRPIPPAPRKN